MLLTTLPTDLIYDILLALDDRTSLAAFVCCSRQLNDAFKTHPNAALRQVVCNEIGMDIKVLPYAWTYLMFLGDAQLPGGVASPIENVTPGLEDSLTVALTSYSVAGLKQGHSVVQGMENSYSIRYGIPLSLFVSECRSQVQRGTCFT